jgi:hypothetical protein
MQGEKNVLQKLLSQFDEWRFVPGSATRVPAGRKCREFFVAM